MAAFTGSFTGSLLQVQPGDIISSSLINQMLARLGALETGAGTGLALGPLGVDVHTLVALGTGFEAGGGIFLDGSPLLTSQVTRGVNLVILDSTLTVKFRQAYDTFGSASAANDLAADLNAQAAPQDIVIAVTHDAYASQLNAAARAALAAVGGAALGRAIRLRDNAAFIGIVPANRGAISYDYLSSIVPADLESSAANARLAALLFVWGIYSLPLKRFLLGGGTSNAITAQPTPTSTVTLHTLTLPNTVLNSALTATLNSTLVESTLIGPTLIRPTRIGPSLINQPLIINRLVEHEESVQVIPGLGREEQRLLHEAGIGNVGALAEAEPARLAETLNVQPVEAAGLVGIARALLGPR
ncbi:MAG: hypothetical protein HYR56_11995 [Acidobacteria bacterium]|nr:hypothetical protein [Acidobacteriota bacterium]